MKPVLFLLVLFASFLVLGCQDSQLVDPMSSISNNSAVARPALDNEPVEFSWKVNGAGKTLEQIFEVKGLMQFELTENPVITREQYNLTCTIEGELYTENFENLVGKASIGTFDQFGFVIGDDEEYVVLQKSMKVQGSEIPYVINMQLTVYHQRIEVTNVWLTAPAAINHAQLGNF